jgi:membrane protein required for colicin V production
MIIDIITVLLVAFGFYQGFSKGLIKTVFATLSLIIGIVAMMKLSPIVIGILQGILSFNVAIINVIGFVLTFFIAMLLIRFIGNKLEDLFEALNIGILNKILGGALLGLFYAILISFVVFFVNKAELISDEYKATSFTYPMLEPLPELTKGIGRSLQPIFSEFWDKMIETMDALKDKGDELHIEPIGVPE